MKPADEHPEASARIERGALLAERYRVLGHLGQGAMGSVYDVLDEHLEERVALKLLHAHLSDDRSFRAQLRAEVRLARRVSHPNVCRVHDLGRHGEALFVTMELVVGESVRELLIRGDTPRLSRKIDLIIQLCSALAAAHRAGVLHRDVKPANVLVASDRAVLTDFGVASLVDSGSGGAGLGLVGTAAYIAPEVVMGAPADTRVDVYAAAVVSFELLSGQLPFPISTLGDCLRHAETPSPYPGLHPGCAPAAIRAAIDEVLEKALSSDPSSRPRDIDRFAEALSRASRGEHTSTGASPTVSLPAETDTEPGAARARVTTALSFVSPQDVAGEELERAVSDWGGYIVSLSSRGVRAVFGAPIARGDDALRGARAGLDLLERYGGLASIDTARRSFQLAVDGTLLGFDSAFDTLDALMCCDGELGCSAASARHVASHFAAEPRGKDAGGRARFAVRPRQSVAPSDVPLIGRELEREALAAVVRSAFEERQPQIVELIGDAGSGKTRLWRELARELATRREVDWIIGHGAPTRSTPFAALRSADASWYRAAEGAPPGDSENAAAAARAWLLKRAARRPVCVVIEDGQWLDEASLAFLESLPANARSAPIVVIIATRKRITSAARSIEVSRLTHTELAWLAKQIAPKLEPRIVSKIAVRAAGNPLFLTELVRHRLSGAGGSVIPATVEAAIQGRTDRLLERPRELLEAASVIGPAFSLDLLRSLLKSTSPTETIEAELTALVSSGELSAEADGDSFRFRSPLVRDVIYHQLDPSARTEFHRCIALELEKRPPEPGRFASLGHHWQAAAQPVRARLALREAGREALGLFAYAEALAALEAAESLTPESERDAELLELVGDALSHRDAAAAESRFRAALSARSEDELEARAQLAVKISQTLTVVADYTAAERVLEDALASATSNVSEVTRAQILAQLGWVVGYMLGDNARGLPCAEEAVAILETHDDKRALARALGRLGANYMRAGRWRDQLACNLKNLALAQELGDTRSVLTAKINLGVTHSSLGEIDVALEHTFAALELVMHDGYAQLEPLTRNNLAGLLLEKGELAAALSQAESVIELAESASVSYVLPETYCTLARLSACAGDWSQAADHARTALEHARAAGSTIEAGAACRLLGSILGRGDAPRNGREEAGRLFLAALDALRETDPYEYAKTEIAYGRFLGQSDESPDWRRGATSLKSGRATLERLGASLDLARIEDPNDIR